MKRAISVALSFLLCFSAVGKDRLEVYQDYDLSNEIIMLTTVKIDPNMEDVYLAGLSQTWIKAVKLQKQLGYIKDWGIYGSDLPQSGDFNMILLVKFANAADLEPNKKRYEAFMKKWGEDNKKNSQKVSAKYPEVRTLTGQYRMREILMK
ncbi:hypothetical protein [Thalassotalea sp. G2M2-11]|uniref:hypothetical protein n=1 Tax=Thalassotalea sp. G2M2-11 TaxID=2787627 RepID=UPI0019D0F215|nr:hypothetical protein [Thalassotalea sp. G2M2-11]